MVTTMINEIGKKEKLFLVEYNNKIEEAVLNWGFVGSYIAEEMLPLLFIYSNFPTAKKTNKRSLVGNLRALMEERKGIIFFPTHLKGTIEELVDLSLKKENVSLVMEKCLDNNKITIDFLKEISNAKFSFENIRIMEVRKMVHQTSPIAPNVHQELFKHLENIQDKEVVCFMLDKERKAITEPRNMDQQAAPSRKATFSEIVHDKAFMPRFNDLFLGKDSIPVQIKNFLEGKNWRFDSLLIFYGARRKRTFIQDLPGSAFFFNSSDNTFMMLNTQFTLMNYSYVEKPDQKFSIVKNNISQRFDIFEDKIPIDEPVLKNDLMKTFVNGTEVVNQFLEKITHTRTNEFRFFFDQMCIFVKISGNKYFIETYKAR